MPKKKKRIIKVTFFTILQMNILLYLVNRNESLSFSKLKVQNSFILATLHFLLTEKQMISLQFLSSSYR